MRHLITRAWMTLAFLTPSATAMASDFDGGTGMAESTWILLGLLAIAMLRSGGKPRRENRVQPSLDRTLLN